MSDDRASTNDTDIPPLSRGAVLAFRFALGARRAVRDGVEIYDAFGDVGIGEVTVKLVRPASAGPDGGMLALHLSDQAENLRTVTHPGIVKLVADGWDEPLGARFLVVERPAGEPLETRLARTRKLDVATSLAYAEALCEVLGALHAQGLVHLDLAPSDVTLAPPGAPFPLKVAETGGYRVGEVSGPPSGGDETLPYLAPERLRGEVCDARADIHGIGAVLYRMLGGHAPFRGISIAEVLESRRKGAPPLFAAGVSPADEADRAARKCLADDPAQRFAAATELQALLAELRTRRPGTSRAGAPSPAK